MDVSIRPSEPIPVIQSQEQYPLEQRRRPVNFEAARRSNEHSARASSHGDRSSPERASNGHSSFPEGGWRAYLVLFGVWCALLPASGLLNTIGTLQAYLGTHQLGQHSQQQIGWIFSVYAFLWAFGGVQVGTQKMCVLKL